MQAGTWTGIFAASTIIEAHCNTLYHTVPHYNTLYHNAPRCTTLHTAPHCATLHHTAAYCTTLHCATLRIIYYKPHYDVSVYHLDEPPCTTLHHTAPHCTTLHHTAPHYTTLRIIYYRVVPAHRNRCLESGSSQRVSKHTLMEARTQPECP